MVVFRGKSARRVRAYRKRKASKYRTRGTGRGYRTGYNRFGRISGPELKSKVLNRDGTTAAATVQQLVVFPSIVQGFQDDQRIGNRINGKFLNIKLILWSQRPADATLPIIPPVVRYVLWQTKDSTSLTGTANNMNNLSLVNFLNTKSTRILKTGYVTLSAAGTAKIKALNCNLRNRTFDYIANTDTTANTSQHIYLTVFSNQLFSWEHQSKFYFADP